jgi:hypothetical protein
MTRRVPVEHADVVPLLDEGIDDVGAHEATSTGDEDLHRDAGSGRDLGANWSTGFSRFI